MVEVLIGAGADPSELHSGWTALHVAVGATANHSEPNREIIEILMKAGVDPSVRSKSSRMKPSNSFERDRHPEIKELFDDYERKWRTRE